MEKEAYIQRLGDIQDTRLPLHFEDIPRNVLYRTYDRLVGFLRDATGQNEKDILEESIRAICNHAKNLGIRA